MPKSNKVGMVPFVVVQVIRSTWDKSSRGGNGAVERNQMPEVCPFPTALLPTSEPRIAVHRVGKSYALTSGKSSQAPYQELTFHPIEEPFEYGCAHVELTEGFVHVDYRWNRKAGMPERYPRKEALVLCQGEWGQLRYNERHSPDYDGDWSYEKWVFNIGLFTTISPNVFTATKPVTVFSRIDHLW